MNLLVLEIDPSIPLTSELVRRQYNQIRGRYRIEKLEKMGPEIVSIGRTKCEELLRAATSLMEKLGESLELHSEPTLPRDLRHNPDLDDVFGV